MTNPAPAHPESELLPPEPSGVLSVPPPVPQKKPGFLRRLFTSRKKQQTVAIQNGYLEMVDLIRAIRSHLDRQENVQTSVLSMLEKVPDVMERQHEVMTIFKQQLENGMENNRRLTDSMGNLNNTLASMDESQRASSRTVTDLIHRSRESEQLLREVMRRAERRMALLLAVFILLVLGMGIYFVRWQARADQIPAPPPAAKTMEPAAIKTTPTPPRPVETKTRAAADEKIREPDAKKTAVTEPVKTEKVPEFLPESPKKKKTKGKAKAEPKPATAPDEKLDVGPLDLTLDQIKQATGEVLPDSPVIAP